MGSGLRSGMTIRPSEVGFLAVYGTLRRRSQSREGYLIGSGLQFYGYGLLRGLRFVQCGYPAVVEQPGLVQVEIFRVLHESIWPILDRYEGCKPEIGRNSLFIRKAVALVRPAISAWVYFLGREIPRGRTTEIIVKNLESRSVRCFLRKIKRDYGNALCDCDDR
jgi:gamma-glutamylcyclotransferase (GGCT)/AIG2-like uncharacterized protein YtfP